MAKIGVLPFAATGLKRSSGLVRSPEKLKHIGPAHPQVLVYPVEHGAPYPSHQRVGLASSVSHIELAFEEGSQEVNVPNIRMLSRSTLPDRVMILTLPKPTKALIETLITEMTEPNDRGCKPGTKAGVEVDEQPWWRLGQDAVSGSEKGCRPPYVFQQPQ